MSDGVLVDDAIQWTTSRGETHTHDTHHAKLGKYEALVWYRGNGIMWRPWRGSVRSQGSQHDRRRVASYRTEDAAKLATGARLRKVAT